MFQPSKNTPPSTTDTVNARQNEPEGNNPLQDILRVKREARTDRSEKP